MRQRRFVVRHGCQRVQRGRLSMQERRFQVRPGGDSTLGAPRCTADLPPYPRSGPLSSLPKTRPHRKPPDFGNIWLGFPVRSAFDPWRQEVCGACQGWAGALHDVSPLPLSLSRGPLAAWLMRAHSLSPSAVLVQKLLDGRAVMLCNTGVIATPGEIKRRALEGFRCAPLNILKPRTANLQTRTGNLPCCTGNLL